MSAHLTPDELELAARAGSTSEHLASCAQCQADVKRAKGRQRLMGGMTKYTLSDVAFRRVEARLAEAVEAGTLRPSPWKWASWVLAGAVLASIGLVLILRDDSLSGVLALPRQQATIASIAFHDLTVIRASEAQVKAPEGWHGLAVGDVVGDRAAVSAKAITLAPADETSWAFEASGSLAFGGGATVTLGAGELTAHVASPVEVLASTRHMRTADALFVVTHVGAEVVLRVAEGSVEVVDSETSERLIVSAPDAMRWSDGSSLAQGRKEPVVPVAAVVVPGKPWVTFDSSALPQGTRVSLDGMDLGTAPFVAVVGGGRRELSLNGVTSWVELVGGGSFFPKVELAERGDGPTPDADALRRVMAELQRNEPKLAACYEKWLKANRAAEGDVTLELTVTAKGRVKDAQVTSGTLSKSASDCLVRTAKTIALPQLGVDATLELPLMLRSH